jgi:hypothetical protein
MDTENRTITKQQQSAGNTDEREGFHSNQYSCDNLLLKGPVDIHMLENGPLKSNVIS